ncbi:MAG: sigma-70 family RNA polymerase sigma factor [Planctomycetota bacterium]|nr:sigma-70 family RNA polymerase sigma factor [Planctomycetota bacterium]
MIAPVRPSDYRLLHRFAFEEDSAAFEELVRRHGGMARGVCRRVLGPAGDADDAAQAAFLSLAQNARPLISRLGPSGSLAGWLYRVAVNAALQQRRASKARRRREATVVREKEPWSEGATSVVERSELLVVLDEELKELPSRYRTPLVLCHLEGKTQHEAAEQLGLSYGTLRRRLDRGRKLLRARIGRRGMISSSAMIALIWKSSAVESSTVPARFVASVAKAVKQPATGPVAVVRPRVTAAGHIPRSAARLSTSLSATAYSILLAAVLTAMVIPPVVSMIASAGSSGSSHNVDRPSEPLRLWPSGPVNRSAV